MLGANGKSAGELSVPQIHKSNGTATSYIVHDVKMSDTLAGLSLKYGVPIEDIRKANNLSKHSGISALFEVRIPQKGSESRYTDRQQTYNDEGGVAKEELNKQSSKGILRDVPSPPSTSKGSPIEFLKRIDKRMNLLKEQRAKGELRDDTHSFSSDMSAFKTTQKSFGLIRPNLMTTSHGRVHAEVKARDEIQAILVGARQSPKISRSANETDSKPPRSELDKSFSTSDTSHENDLTRDLDVFDL